MTHEHQQHRLSPEGERRREAILHEVSGRLPAIARRRRAKRRAAAGTLAVLLLAGAAVVWMIPTAPTPTPAPTTAPQVVLIEPDIEYDPLIDYAVVESSPVDPSVYVRTDTESINAMVITDDELLRELAAIGRPAGLIRMNGQVRLTRDVVDPQAVDPLQ